MVVEMPPSLTEYWSQLAAADRVHPDDRLAWGRLSPSFANACLPTPYYGRIIDAPVVLLFLSPGLSPNDPIEAESDAAQTRYVRIRAGSAPLPSKEEWPDFWRWVAPRLRAFGEPMALRERVAILNISGYKSKDFHDYPALAALPSCRFSIDWAQRVLFPAAEAGERVVVCLRGAQWWGLEAGRAYSGTLFAPAVNRAGHMLAASLRSEIIDAVRRAMQ